MQEAVLASLSDRSEVVSIVKRPITLNREYKLFERTPIGHTLTGYFTCNKHESIFDPIEKQDPDFSNELHKALFAYKAVLFQIWTTRLLRFSWEAESKEDPKSDLPKYFIRLCEEAEKGLSYYKRTIEEAIDTSASDRPTPVDGIRLKHHVVHIPTSKRILAACEWQRGLRRLPIDSPEGIVLRDFTNAGITVYPREDDHVVLIHRAAEERGNVMVAICRISDRRDLVRQKQRLSRYLLEAYENVVFSPLVWANWAPEKREAIKEFFVSTMPETGLEFENGPGGQNQVHPNDGWHAKRLRLVNLFEL